MSATQIGTLQFLPEGLWQIDPNTPTTVPSSYWESANSSDAPTNARLKTYVYPSDNGQIVLPYAGTFLINLYCDMGDFAYSGMSSVALIFVPNNSESSGPTYTMATRSFSSNSPTGTVSNYVQGNQGDVVNIQWNFADGLDSTVASAPNTTLYVIDTNGNQSPIYYYGESGQPPQIGTEVELSIMQTATVENNMAIFTTTQSGNLNDYSVFNVGISYVDVALIATTSDTTLLPPSDWYVMPYPADLKTVTIVFAKPGTPGYTWKCKCLIQGQ